MTDSMHRNTPSLTVYDSRGLAVRQTDYYRAQVDAPALPCVSVQVYDSQGRAVAAWDPRLFELRSKQPDVAPNFATVYSLSGEALSSRSVDAGEKLCLFAPSGAAVEAWDVRASHWQTELDELARPVAIHEQIAGQPRRTCKRFGYAGGDADSASCNQCGRQVRIDDSAGTQRISEYSLTGAVLLEERRMLQSFAPPDWPLAPDERDPLLEPDTGAISRWHFDASGTKVSATDARGNRQGMRLNVAGQVTQMTLTLLNGAPQVLLREVHYNACGQIESQTAGNGVISQYRYHRAEGRLHTLHTTRAANGPLQLLTYSYDPVGNVTSITDDAEAEAVRHFANQRVELINRYAYDSFNQLIEAQGWETAKISSGPQLPDMQPLPIDSSQWLNFTERYRYDTAGNLTQLRHEGSQSYTREFEVHDASNRALIKLEGQAPPDFAAEFDACGNLQHLRPGQLMAWDAGNRLSKITTVSRQNAEDDREQYVYDHSGQRLRKITITFTRATLHSREVRYLPGLELRSDSASHEQLEVIVIQAGRCAVRCLHWLSGRPTDIENDQLRYSVDDHLGSSTLELDAHARLISHEGYYPFGGTAWWAARSALKAKYRVARYSGKERDASGLYYYGARYYAPWLMRWVSADPDGAVDGLNLYRMVSNNPMKYVDHQGRQSIDSHYLLAIFLFAAAALIWLVSARRAGSQSFNQFHHASVAEFSLNEEEARILKNHLAEIEGPAEWSIFRSGPNGQINIYRAASAQDYLRLTHSNRSDFFREARRAGISPFQLREANRQPQAQERRDSVSSISSANSAFSVDSPSRARTVRRDKKTKNAAGRSSADNFPDSPRLEITGSLIRIPQPSIDAEGFFEDPAIARWLAKPAQQALGMEQAIQEAINNYSSGRYTHTGLGGVQTLDLNTANRGGRGDYRLSLSWRGGTLRPTAVLSHKRGVLVQRKD